MTPTTYSPTHWAPSEGWSTYSRRLQRVGIVVFELDRNSGGLGQWCWQFVTALARRTSAVHVITGRFGEGILPANVARHRIPAEKSRVAFAGAAAKHVRQLKLDVVHDMGAGWQCDIFQPHGGSHAAWLARRADMYPGWLQALKRPLDAILPRQRDFIRHCRRQFATDSSPDKTFIALSHTVADDFVRLHGVKPEQIAVIYNGIDCQRFSPTHRALYRDTVRQQLKVRDDDLLLLLAAHHFRLKGVPELLAVVARLASLGRAIRFVVVGGKRVAKWQRAADRAGLAGLATFVGAVRDTVPYYASADAYVHPTYYDPCSLVILEAAASGLPIVTTRRCNGAAELFRSGHEILTIEDPRDAPALIECVDALFDERLRQRLGEAARRNALRHTFERNVAEVIALYDRTAARRIAA
jgi:UDP-glucose:(heptosyl)LPS alpha-1,3-glucosyltransferase